MHLTTPELIVFNELKDKISAWFNTGTVVFNEKHRGRPDNEFIAYADIELIDMSRVVREPSLSSSKLLDLLREDYAFIVAVNIEPEVDRVLIRINKEEHDKLPTP